MTKFRKLTFFAVAVLMSATSALCLAACGKDDGTDNSNKNPPSQTVEEAHVHVWTEDASLEKQPTCGESGRKYYSCECGATKTVRTTAASGNHTDEDGDGVCDVCGYIDMSELTQEAAIETYGYFVEDKDESGTYTLGDYVYFGSYPQELVNVNDLNSEAEYIVIDATNEGERVQTASDELIAALEAQEGTLPTAENKGDWTSYLYYDNGEKSDYMFYKDVEVDGTKYRGVYMLDYRAASFASTELGAENSYTDEEGYKLETVYWFEYKPIVWKVLDYIDGELLLNCVYSIDAQAYQDEYVKVDSSYYVPGTTTNLNAWETSTLRAFLNGTFYNLAFTANEKSLIALTELDNKTTGYLAENEYQTSQNNTEDYVFLLSYQDMMNTDYGFPDIMDYDEAIQKGTQGEAADAEEYAASQARRHHFSDYAATQGLRRSNVAHTSDGEPVSWYALRSAGGTSYTIMGISKYGSIEFERPADGSTHTVNSVVPSLYLKVGK